MSNMPFGFSPPLKTGRKHTKNLVRMIRGGLNAGGLEGAMFGGFAGLPWLQRSSAMDPTRHGDGNGPMQWMSWRNGFGFGGYGGGGNGGNGGGNGGGGDGGGNGGGNGGGGGGNVNPTPWTPIDLLYPPPIGTGEQWRNTMKYGA